jgi:hypothetical protein
MLRVMRPRRWLTSFVAVAVVLTGCGSGGDNTASSTGGSASSSSAATSPAATGLRSRVLTSNELPGFHAAGISVFTTPDSWIALDQSPPDQAAAEKAMLKRDGFRAAVHEDLRSDSADGASIVVRFRSPQAAADGLRFYVKRFRALGLYATFKVTGVPGAVGYTIGGADAGGVNIVFTDGAYYYLVGRERGGKAGIAKLQTAAQRLYNRVHA